MPTSPDKLSPKQQQAVLSGTAPVESVPWTTDLVFKVLRIDPAEPRVDAEEQMRAAVEAGELPPEAVTALRKSGYLKK